MKRIINILLIFGAMFFLFLTNVNAWSISFEQEEYMGGGYLYGDRLNPGEVFRFVLIPEKDDSESIGQFSTSVTVSYSSNLFIFDDYNDFYDYYDVEAQSGKVIINFSSDAIKNPSFLILSFKAKESITSNSTGSISLTYNIDGVQKSISEKLNVVMPSSNALLSSLSIKEGSLSPTFNSNVFYYTATVNSKYLNIECDEADKNAYSAECNKSDLFGGYFLNYGVNNFDIKVTAEDGTIKTYTIAVTRPDNRSDDSTLKSITLSDGNINFNRNTQNYNVDVTSGSVKLTATANNSNAKVEYLNGSTVSLNYGESKTIKIKVTSEKGTTLTYSVTLTRKDTRSNDSSLKNITLSDGNIDFNSNTKNYNVTVSASKVTLNAVKNNEYATVSYPSGNSVNLEYGQTATLKVKVTAQNGMASIYTINLTRKDTRSSDNTLKSLFVSNTNIKYNNKTMVYNAQVENNIEKISISATSNNNKAIISGTGTKSLGVGNNSFIVKVVAENGDAKEYIIIINRKAKATNKEDNNKTLSSDNYLKHLSIEEATIDFSKNLMDYNIFVDYGISNINLSYETSSPKAIVSMTGETNLQVGLNIIKLVVVAENGDVRTYTLNINRRPERNIVENTEDAIMSAINSSDLDDIYIVVEKQDAPCNVSSSILTALNQTGKTIFYEIVDNKSVIYQLKLIGGEITNPSGFTFEVLFDSTKDRELKELVNSALYLPVRFNYNGKIPGMLYLSIYNADEKLVSSDSLKLYEYEVAKNKLNLIDSIDVYENVIELKIDDIDKEYVLIDNLKITNSLNDKDNKINNNVLYTILLSVVLALVIILIILVIKRFINKKKNIKFSSVNLNDFDNIETLDEDKKIGHD